MTDRFTGLRSLDFKSIAEQRFLQLSSIDYVGSSRRFTSDPSFRQVFHGNGVSVYRYRDALPRLAVYSAFRRVDDDDRALQLLTSPAFDPLREVLITASSADAGQLPSSAPSASARVGAGTIERYDSQHVVGTVDAQVSAVVVLNDTGYPGWIASIDGRETKIFAANYLFRGIVVPSGHHTITFDYRPRSYRIGLIITLLSFIAAGMYLAYGAWTSRRARTETVTDG